MDSDNTEIEKLIGDETFRNWALGKNQHDIEKWEILLRNNDKLSRLAEEAKSTIILVELAEEGISEQENQSALMSLLIKISKEDSAKEEAHQLEYSYPNHWISSVWPWVKYAAVFAVLVLAVVFLYDNYNSNLLYKSGIEKVAPTGEFLTVRLPDGSKVKLNSNSKLVFPKDFSKGRIVTLTGEAFFEVTKNKKMPFRVITNNFTVEVLGTSFNINTYDGDKQPKITVVTGKVKVKMNNGRKDSLVLVKNEAALFDSQKDKILPVKYDQEELLWRSGIIAFKNAGIEDIAQRLEHQFGVKVEIVDPQKINGEFTGRYDNEELENILEGTSYVLGFSFEIDESGKKVTINKLKNDRMIE